MIHSELNSDTNDEELEFDLRKVLKVMQKWSKLIITLTLLTTLASGLISYFYLKPVFQAKTLLMVTLASDKLEYNPEQQMAQNGLKPGLVPIPVLTMNTYLGQLKSEVVMNRVITAINLTDQNSSSLSEKIDARIVSDTNLIEVKVNYTDPLLAANIANDLSNEYINLMKELMLSSVVVISPASIPSEPVKPNKQLNIAIAFVLGLIISVLTAFLLEYLDDTMKTTEDVNRELGLPVLGLIPIRTKNNIRQSTYGDSI